MKMRKTPEITSTSCLVGWGFTDFFILWVTSIFSC